jgi:hypothetical protein
MVEKSPKAPMLAAIDQRAQQHAADDAEDGRVGADAKGQRDDDGEGQPLGARQRAQAHPHVEEQRRQPVEPAAVPHPPHRVANRRHVAELAQRGQPGRLRILAAFDPLLDAERQMAADLVVELVLIGSHGSLGVTSRRRRAPGS